MKKIYIFLQFMVSLYWGQLLIDWNRDNIHMIISLLCVHLILYLISVIVIQPSRKQLILGVDIMYLVVATLGENSALLIILFLTSLEFLQISSGSIKKIGVVGVNIWLITMWLAEVLDNWFIYGMFLGISFFIYFNEKRLVQLIDTRDALMEQVSRLNKLLEGLKQENKQMAYITKVTERNKLAQQLHDKIGHLLAGNVMQLEAIKIILTRDEEKGLELLDQVTSSLRGGMDDIRFTLKDLKPGLGESGLSQIKKSLQHFKEKTGIIPKFIYEGDLESIDLEKWHVIHENLKETITNFIKYSKGNYFSVSIEVMNKLIKVSFKDNGRIDGPISKGLGLMGIEERTLSIDGKLIINIEEGFETIMLIKR